MALIPPNYMHCVAAIGVKDRQGEEIKWIASSFIYGHLLSPPRTREKDQRYVFALVSNRHVFDGKNEAVVRFNRVEDRPPLVLNLPLVDNEGNKLWRGHRNKKIDVAVIPINLDVLRRENALFFYFLSNKTVANIKKLNELEVTEGDAAYILGYPMALVGEKRQTVIVREGAIALIRDALNRTNKEFLVDAQIFPGNSGGPVILKPEGFSIKGTKAQMQSLLIGIVSSYVPYRDVARSDQTGLPRIIFEENSGLAAAHPMDYVQSVMRQIIKERNLRPRRTVPEAQ